MICNKIDKENYNLNINVKMTTNQCFKVFVRCRPLNQKQLAYGKSILQIFDQSTILISGGIGKETPFQLDQVFHENHDNINIFHEIVTPLAQNYLSGFNSTIIAYGITGAGKSHTMFGNSNERGLIPLTFQYLLNRIEQQSATFKLSYIEIYNEQVYDLLNPSVDSLQLIEDPVSGISVPGLKQTVVKTIDQALSLIQEGNTRRVVAQTKANEFSSRSHAIVFLTLQRQQQENIVSAKFSLVDLAGSERQSVYNQGKNIRNLQGSNINKSLLTLGNCINILSEKKKTAFVPYRDSKLTRLLKDSLGGNAKTIMIACISGSITNYDETLNTLKYACRAKKIQKVVYQNIKESKCLEQYKKQIEKLKKQNAMLKAMQGMHQNQTSTVNHKKLYRLLLQLIKFSREDENLQAYENKKQNFDCYNSQKIEKIISSVMKECNVHKQYEQMKRQNRTVRQPYCMYKQENKQSKRQKSFTHVGLQQIRDLYRQKNTNINWVSQTIHTQRTEEYKSKKSQVFSINRYLIALEEIKKLAQKSKLSKQRLVQQTSLEQQRNEIIQLEMNSLNFLRKNL